MPKPTELRGHRMRPPGASLAGALLLTGAILLHGGSLSGQSRGDAADAGTSDSAREIETIRCALPADVERLGTQVTRVGPRDILEISPEDCEARGGEVVADRTGAETEATGSSD